MFLLKKERLTFLLKVRLSSSFFVGGEWEAVRLKGRSTTGILVV